MQDISQVVVVVKSEGFDELTAKQEKLAAGATKVDEATKFLGKSYKDLASAIQEQFERIEVIQAQSRGRVYAEAEKQSDRVIKLAQRQVEAESELHYKSTGIALAAIQRQVEAESQLKYKALAEAESIRRKTEQGEKASLDRQLQLEFNYAKASLAGKIKLAQDAQLASSMGLDGGSMFGSSASKANMQELTAQHASYQAATAESTKKVHSFSLANAGASRELIVLAHELSQGSYSKFGGSLLVLAERTNITTQLVAFALNPFTLLAVAALGIGLAALASAHHFKEFQTSLNTTNDYVKLTSHQLFDMSTALGETTGSLGASREALHALVSSGRVAGDQLMIVGKVAVDMATNTGEAVSDVAMKIADMSKDVMKSAMDYQSTHHAMNSVDMERIQTLVNMGQSTQAYTELLKLMEKQEGKTREEREKGMTLLNGGLLWGIKAMFSATSVYLGKLVEGENIQEKYNHSLEAQLNIQKSLNDMILNGADKEYIASYQMKLKSIEGVVAALKEQLKAQTNLDAGNLHGAGGDLASAVKTYDDDTKHQSQADKKARAITAENTVFNDIVTKAQKVLGSDLSSISKEQATKMGVDQAQSYVLYQNTLAKHKRTLVQIEEDYKPKNQDASINDQYREKLLRIQEQIDAANDKMKSAQAENDSAFKAGAMSRIEMIQRNADVEAAAYLKMIALKSQQHDIERPDNTTAKGRLLLNEEAALKTKSSEVAKHQAQEEAQYFHKLDVETNDARIKEAEASGQHVLAAKLRYENAYANEVQLINGDIENYNAKLVEASFGDANQEAESTKLIIVALEKLEAKKKQIEATANATKGKAQGQEDVAAIQGVFDQMAIEIEKINAVAQKDGGLTAQIFSARALVDVQNTYMPRLRTMAKAAMDAMNFSGAPQEQKNALSKLMLETEKAVDKKNDLIKKSGGMFFTDEDLAKLKLAQEGFADLGKTVASLGDNFKSFGGALAGIGKAFGDVATIQAKSTGDAAKDASIRIGAYGDMATAAEGFFAKGSKGARAMHAVSVALHAEQLVMDLVRTASGIMAGAATMFGQSGWGGFAGVAAMGAVMAGLGFAMSGSGGGGGVSAADVQKTQGTGSVFGDSTAKSDSINQSITELSKNFSLLLPVNKDMLTSLRAIQTATSGLSSQIQGVNGLADGTNLGIKTGTTNSNTAGLLGVFAIGGPVALVLDKALGGIFSKISGALFGKTSQNIVDSGLNFKGTVAGLSGGQGFNQYASVDTTTSRLFGLSKNTTNAVTTNALDGSISSQLGSIFKGVGDALKGAAAGLGTTSAAIEKSLNSITITGAVSTKGLTGKPLTDALNAVLSKAIDDMATAAFPKLVQFRLAGEGMAQTVTRVSNTVSTVSANFATLGLQLFKLDDAGIKASLGFVELMGGLDQFGAASKTYYEKFYTDGERSAEMMKSLGNELAKSSLILPKTKADYRALVEQISKTGTPEQLAKLLNLSGTFSDAMDMVSATMDKAGKKVLDAMNIILGQLDKVASFKTSLGGSSQQIETSQLGYDPVAYANKQVVSYKTELANTSGVDKQLIVAGKLQTAIMDRYAAENTAVSKRRDVEAVNAQSRLDASNKAGSAAVDAANKISAAYKAIGDYAKGLLTGANSPLSGGAAFNLNAGAYASLKKELTGGNITNAGNFSQTADAFLKSSMEVAVTAADYAKSFYTVLGDAQGLGAKDGGQQTWQDAQTSYQRDSIVNQEEDKMIQDKALGELAALNAQTDLWTKDLNTQLAAQADIYVGMGFNLTQIAENTASLDTRIGVAIRASFTSTSAINSIPVFTPSGTSTSGNAPSGAALTIVSDGLKSIQTDNRIVSVALVEQAKKTATILQRWENNGQPETRSIV